MRLPFKTEDDLSKSLAATSESIRIDYQRRLEQSSVAALSAHFEKELSKEIEYQISTIGAQIKKVNLVAIILLFVLGAITLTADLPYGRIVVWFVVVLWVVYIGAMDLFFLPVLRIKQVNHWNGYQIHAREWSTLLGNTGFSEHLSLVGTEYQGDVYEDADNIELAIRGFAFVRAKRSASR